MEEDGEVAEDPGDNDQSPLVESDMGVYLEDAVINLKLNPI